MIDTGEALRKLTLGLMRYSGLASLAKPMLGGVGAILMLHRVTEEPAGPESVNRHLRITPSFLDRLIAAMKQDGYDFVSMDDACARIAAGASRQRFATITADDGYRDNLVEALPVLERHAAPIAVYAAPGLVDRTAYLWWDVIESIVDLGRPIEFETGSGPVVLDCSTVRMRFDANVRLHRRIMTEIDESAVKAFVGQLARTAGIDPEAASRSTLMDWDELRRMADHPLVTIGAHSISHPNLRRLSDGAARREIEGCADLIAERLSVRPRHFAYPYGFAAAVGPREVAMARDAGYVSAVTTRHGVIHPGHADHLCALPRISVNGRYQQVGHVRTMLSGVTTPLANAGRLVVTV